MSKVICLHLHLLKCTRHFPKLQRVAIVDRRGLIRLQALAVDACGICAVQIRQRIGAANVFKGGMNAGNGFGALHRREVYLRIDAAQVVVVAPYHVTLSHERDLLAVAEGQGAPGSFGIISRFR